MAEERVQRRLAAVLAADVVGFSRLMEVDETGTLALLKERRKEILTPLVAEHHGRIIKLMGDGVLVEFASAVNAVSCAVDLQKRMAAANDKLGEDTRIVLRIGINIGDVVVEGSDLYGDGVNIAARLERLAEPGSVYISGNVYEQIRGKLTYEFHELGPRQLHNIRNAVIVYRLTIAPSSILATDSTSAISRDRTTIAILPFTLMAGGREQEYLADGIVEDLITELARFRQLEVIARNSTFIYKNQTVKVSDIGRQLGADFVVEGSLRRVRNRLRINVQLIDVETGAHVWAERFDRDLEDVFALQDELVRSLAERLSLNLEEAAALQMQRRPCSATAYSCYLQARAAWRNGDEQSAFVKALEGVRVDPNYARVLAQAAFHFAWGRFSGVPALSSEECSRRALELVERAISLEKNDPMMLDDVAATYAMLGNQPLAKRYIEAAAAQNPHDIDIMMVRGSIMAWNGQYEEGLAILEHAIRTDPRLSPAYPITLGEARYLARDYQGAVSVFETIADIPLIGMLALAASLAQTGKVDEARHAMARAKAATPKEFSILELARNYAALCTLSQDKEHWRDGFRKAGLDM